MSQRPSADSNRRYHPTDPTDRDCDGTDAVDANSVPGDPPVPITVWRTPAGADGDLLGQSLAARLVAAYTRRGDIILDVIAAAEPSGSAGPAGTGGVSGDPVLAGAAAAAGRVHRTIPRRGGGEHAGDAALAVCCWPLPRAGLIDPVIALGGLRRRLRPGGVLAVIAPAPAPGAGPAQLGPAVRAAADAGLCYLQHIVAMHAAVAGEDIVPAAGAATTGAELTAAGARVGGAAHWPAHTDVLIFTRPGQARG